MGVTYKKRNLENISKLAPNTRALALQWHDFLVKHGIDILIYETIRTKETQALYVEKGVSKTMRSYHLVGQALDFVPIVNGKSTWSQSAYASSKVVMAINEAKRLGFKWGGDWKSFIDKPHLEYHYKGYGTDKVLTIQTPKPATPMPKPIEKEEEEDDMLPKAIVIGSLNDYAAAEVLSVRLDIPIYPRGAISGKVAKELIVVGGDKNGLVADKIINLSGQDRFVTAANVAKYLKG